MRTIKTYRKVGAFYIAWEADFATSIHLIRRRFRKREKDWHYYVVFGVVSIAPGAVG